MQTSWHAIKRNHTSDTSGSLSLVEGLMKSPEDQVDEVCYGLCRIMCEAFAEWQAKFGDKEPNQTKTLHNIRLWLVNAPILKIWPLSQNLAHSLLTWNHLRWIPAMDKEMLDPVKLAQGHGDF